jgi:hypothetical protein
VPRLPQRFLAHASNPGVLAMACSLVILSFCSAHAAPIPCRDLATASAKELLATVTLPGEWYGGGVQIGEYDCGNRIGRNGPPTPAPFLPQANGCDWRVTLRDDRMIDRDHRLIYVFSSHLTGSGSWGDLLVFGCASGQVKTVYQGQFCSCRLGPGPNFDSAPPALRSTLEEYVTDPPMHDLPSP